MYQATMPGIDEEIWRAIVIGLCCVIIGHEKYKFGHPSVWLSTFLFAIGHSVSLSNWEFQFFADAFIVSGLLGYLLGWMTYTSRSLIPALILHNLINFSTNLIEMLIL